MNFVIIIHGFVHVVRDVCKYLQSAKFHNTVNTMELTRLGSVIFVVAVLQYSADGT